MQLIKNIIETKMGLYEEFMLKRDYLRAFSHFYSCLNCALAILGERLEKDESRKIKKLWKKLLTENKINQKRLREMKMIIYKNIKKIIKSQKMMNEDMGSSDYYKSKLDKKGAVLVIGYSYPTN